MTEIRSAVCVHCYGAQRSRIREQRMLDNRIWAWFTCADNHFVIDTPAAIGALLVTPHEHEMLGRILRSRGFRPPNAGGVPQREFLEKLLDLARSVARVTPLTEGARA